VLKGSVVSFVDLMSAGQFRRRVPRNRQRAGRGTCKLVSVIESKCSLLEVVLHKVDCMGKKILIHTSPQILYSDSASYMIRQ